jgi:deoxyadenosine/deoxycytidine kinase
VIEISGGCYSVDCNIFCQQFIISFEFKDGINETLKTEELLNKFVHNLEIYSVKITVYFMYNICNSNALLLTDIFLFHKSMFYEQDIILSQHELQWPLKIS